MAMAVHFLSTSPICHWRLREGFTSKSSQPLQVKQTPLTTIPLQLTREWKNLYHGQNTRNSCRFCVFAEYNGMRGGTGDFLAGFLLGGAVFGALGYLLAPEVRKALSSSEKGIGGLSRTLQKSWEDDGLEKTRKTLNEKIAQLNAAIDNVSAQLKADDRFGITNGNTAEMESLA
eukprot:c22258_g2_i1 orf=124-645(+)